jgi:hypothetical protein
MLNKSIDIYISIMYIRSVILYKHVKINPSLRHTERSIILGSIILGVQPPFIMDIFNERFID